ncbi:MAG: glycosyltransferase family 2 protein [Burkholderiales bacterium]|nr:glycosyltransferase family 2 protein [Burkholderiales bacterium]MBZ0250003.1 glycosyltransferase family 2 protein [Burkholderiales bacterium]MCL4687809.1 glycosyltransferase family 2 protein [Burkholderiales bacterium]
MKDVAVILVGLNANKFVKECIETVEKADWSRHTCEIIYVDNGSKDGSVEMVRSCFPGVRVIANDSNLGYCKAANQGARIADARHFYFLNDDTIVYPDALPVVIDFLDSQPGIGVVGSRLLNLDLTDQWSGRRFPSVWNGILGRRSWLSRLFPNARALTDYLYRDEVAAGVPFEADWVSAAALLVDRDTFARAGMFAEDYYYWHEAVFCDRVRRAGRKVYLHPGSKIIHYEGKGSGARPYPVQRWHILDFHRGAYRCAVEHYNLGRFNPARWLTAAALATRAMVLLAVVRFTSPR